MIDRLMQQPITFWVACTGRLFA